MAHFTIIGGGIVGLTCAWRLAAAGHKIELFEKSSLGSGASLAALGALSPYPPTRSEPIAHLQRQSLSNYPRFVQHLSKESGMSIGYHQLGRLLMLHTAEQKESASADSAASHGTLQLLSPLDVIGKEPFITPSNYGALYDTTTAHVDVISMVNALKNACLKRGVKIHENTPIQRINAVDDTVQSLTLANGQKHPVQNLLIAAGAWSGELESPFDLPTITPVRGQALRLNPPEWVVFHMIKSGEIYIIPEREKGTVLVGSTTEPESGFENKTTPEGLNALLSAAGELVPGLDEAEIVNTWAGLRPKSPEPMPLMRKHDEAENLWLCTGHYKLGYSLLPAIATWADTLSAELNA